MEVLSLNGFARIDQRRGGEQLFRTTLEKALFSSPAACLETIRNRVRRLADQTDPEVRRDIEQLESFAAQVATITPAYFAKYQKLLAIIRDRDDGRYDERRERREVRRYRNEYERQYRSNDRRHKGWERGNEGRGKQLGWDRGRGNPHRD